MFVDQPQSAVRAPSLDLVDPLFTSPTIPKHVKEIGPDIYIVSPILLHLLHSCSGADRFLLKAHRELATLEAGTKVNHKFEQIFDSFSRRIQGAEQGASLWGLTLTENGGPLLKDFFVEMAFRLNLGTTDAEYDTWSQVAKRLMRRGVVCVAANLADQDLRDTLKHELFHKKFLALDPKLSASLYELVTLIFYGATEESVAQHLKRAFRALYLRNKEEFLASCFSDHPVALQAERPQGKAEQMFVREWYASSLLTSFCASIPEFATRTRAAINLLRELHCEARVEADRLLKC